MLKKKMEFLLVVFSLCFSLFICIPESKTQEINCNFNVNVEQHLHNNGFHRNLSFIINFVTDYEDILPWTGTGECHIGLEQILPAGIYASPDEVAKLAFIKSPVNIEESAEEAKDITVHMISQVRNFKATFSLPVHSRYQAAVAGGGKKRNTIQPPKIYLNCVDNKVDCEMPEAARMNNFCPKISGVKCPWKEMPVTMITKTIIWDVPVGNTDHFYIVAAGTVFFIVLASLYLLKTIHEYTLKTKRIKSKMK